MVEVIVSPLLKRQSTTRLRQRAAQLNKWKEYNNDSWLKGFGMICLKIIQRRFLYQPLIVVVLNAFGVALVAEIVGIEREVWNVGTDVTLGLGTPLALLLAFRLNTSYARWWEGRLLWGRLLEDSRSIITGLVAASTSDAADATSAASATQEIAGWCLAFATTLRVHVGHHSKADSELAEDLNEYLAQPALDDLSCWREGHHAPLQALGRLRRTVARFVDERRLASGGTDSSSLVALETFLFSQTEDLHQVLSGIERLLRTPSPPGYVAILRWAIFSFLAVLPFVLLEVGFGMVPVVAVTALIMLGTEDVAVQLEVPFGNDSNDLPLDSYCTGLNADLTELLAGADIGA